jgi:hypothetical protein
VHHTVFVQIRSKHIAATQKSLHIVTSVQETIQYNTDNMSCFCSYNECV